MSLSLSLNSALPAGQSGLQAYQQIKQRGEAATLSAEARSDLRAEPQLERVNVSEAKEVTPPMSLAEQRELERSWGLISAIIGTQVDVFA